jgi:hypothetical protein
VNGRLGAATTWLLVVVVLAGVAWKHAVVDPVWAGLAAFVAVVAVLPAFVHRSWHRTAPTVLTAGAVLPPLIRAFGTDRALDGVVAAAVRFDASLDAGTLETVRDALAATAGVAEWIALATAALLFVVQLQRFTSLHLTVRFAGLVVAVATVGLTAAWTLVRYGAHVEFGTAFATSNAEMARDFGAATVAGVVAGGVFAPVFCSGGDVTTTDSHPGGIVRGIGRLLVFGTQIALVGVLVVGIRADSTGIATNAAGGLLVTFVPPALRRDRGVTIHPALGLWIGAAVLLHAAGTLGPYQTYSWYDTLTHTFSASVVAAVGYALARALDTRQECLRLPGVFLFAYVLLFVLAAGAVWEVFEFLVGLAAEGIGIPTPLVQPSVTDTVTDLAFNTLGGTVVALFATLYLGDGLVEFAGPSASKG